jgi:PTS system fructose-specific IIA component
MTTTIEDLTGVELVTTDLASADAAGAVRELTELLAAAGRVTDVDAYVDAVLAREQETGGTGMGSGIAIPHAKSEGVARASVAFGRSSTGVDFGSEDGTPADLVFLIAAPTGADDLHVTLLSRLARRLVHSSFREALREAPTAEAVLEIITREVTL